MNERKNKIKYYLIADIGGTNLNFEVLKVLIKENNKVTIETLSKQNLKTNNFQNIVEAINKVLIDNLHNREIKVDNAVFGIAGKIDKKILLTNSDLKIDRKEIINKTSLKYINYINDFNALAYSVKALKSTQIKTINEGKKYNNQQISVIGAGTGLGKSILIYNEVIKQYVPKESEGGHCDFPLSGKKEFELCDFIKHKYDKEVIEYEDVISGRGIEDIYEHISDGEIKSASDISELKDKDKLARKTFSTFFKFYARCAKDMTLEHLSLGGVYLAGGIIEKNLSFSKKNFMREFLKNPTFKDMLKEVPIHIIKDYNASMIGLKEYIKQM